MNKQQGIVWAPLLIIIGVVVVAGFAGYILIRTNGVDDSENQNVAVVNQVGDNSNRNTNSATNAIRSANSSATANTNQTTNTNASVNTNTAANTNTVRNTNTATDPTAGWKTYTNTLVHFTLKLPEHWSPVSEFDGRTLPYEGNYELSSFQDTSINSANTSLLIQACSLRAPFNCAQHTLKDWKTFSGFSPISDPQLQVEGFEVGRDSSGNINYVRESDSYYIYAYPSKDAETRVQSFLSTFQFTD